MAANVLLLNGHKIESNAMFSELKQELQAYYSDLRRDVSKLYIEKSANWKKTVYNSLY
jgi:hypothetical protein